MKLSALTIAAALAVALAAFGAGRALGGTTHAGAPTTLRVVMHDPGCHWFDIGGRFTTSATVAGSVRLVDLDIATLKIASRHGMHHVGVGKSIVLGRGSYVIMMAGQASEDNYLRLFVR